MNAIVVRSNAGWHVTLQVLVSTKEILVALPGGDYRSTGFLQAIDPNTGNPAPNPTVTLVEPASIDVKLRTPDGRLLGPFAVSFDPMEALVSQQTRSLEMTKGSWLSFNREWVSFTHLVANRCALSEVRYSLDSAALDQRYALPECDVDDPFTMPRGLDTSLELTAEA